MQKQILVSTEEFQVSSYVPRSDFNSLYVKFFGYSSGLKSNEKPMTYHVKNLISTLNENGNRFDKNFKDILFVIEYLQILQQEVQALQGKIQTNPELYHVEINGVKRPLTYGDVTRLMGTMNALKNSAFNLSERRKITPKDIKGWNSLIRNSQEDLQELEAVIDCSEKFTCRVLNRELYE